MNNQKTQRKKRYYRDPTKTFSLTSRDKEIISLVYLHRFLTSDQIIALAGGSRKGILRRLFLLFHNGFLDRPKAQKMIFGNNASLVYGLGKKGAEVLANEQDLPIDRLDWTGKNREAGGMFLEHSIMVSRFFTILRLACRQVKGIEFIEPADIISKRPVQEIYQNSDLGWKVQSNVEGKNHSFLIIPDGVFGLRFSKGEKGASESYFFLEADRSTMPVKRHNFIRSSIYKKVVGYLASWNQKSFSRNFGFKKARVLTLAISNERIDSMIKLNRDLDPMKKGYGLFLFARDMAFDFAHPERIFSPVWTNGRGEKTSIID